MSNWERKQLAMAFSTQNAASARQPESNEHVLIVVLHLIMTRCNIGIVGQQLVGGCEEDGEGAEHLHQGLQGRRGLILAQTPQKKKKSFEKWQSSVSFFLATWRLKALRGAITHSPLIAMTIKCQSRDGGALYIRFYTHMSRHSVSHLPYSSRESYSK